MCVLTIPLLPSCVCCVRLPPVLSWYLAMLNVADLPGCIGMKSFTGLPKMHIADVLWWGQDYFCTAV